MRYERDRVWGCRLCEALGDTRGRNLIDSIVGYLQSELPRPSLETSPRRFSGDQLEYPTHNQSRQLSFRARPDEHISRVAPPLVPGARRNHWHDRPHPASGFCPPEVSPSPTLAIRAHGEGWMLQWNSIVHLP